MDWGGLGWIGYGTSQTCSFDASFFYSKEAKYLHKILSRES